MPEEKGQEEESSISQESSKQKTVVNGQPKEVILDGACGFGVISLPGKGYKIVPLEGRVEDDNFVPYNFERDPNDDDVLMCVTYMHEFMSRQLLAASITSLILTNQPKVVTPKKGFRIR